MRAVERETMVTFAPLTHRFQRDHPAGAGPMPVINTDFLPRIPIVVSQRFKNDPLCSCDLQTGPSPTLDMIVSRVSG